MQNTFRHGAKVAGGSKLPTVSTAVRRHVADSPVDSVDGVYHLIGPLFASRLRGARKEWEI
ncbi:MAG: hypothetical protein IJG13_19450 [Kiritimatiellae bacterium]|nr:hypothetical protein [Kiritimatiellia bacterium]MBQ3344511.1 hypothetical protein [Kiritimatiellia bacterium]